MPATRSAERLRATGPDERLRDGDLETARAAGRDPALGRVSRGTLRCDRRAERRTVDMVSTGAVLQPGSIFGHLNDTNDRKYTIIQFVPV